MFGVDPFPPWLIAYVTIVILFSGWVQGALGMGFPMVATPLIAAATNMQFAVVTILLPCLATVVVTLAKSPDLRQVVRRFWWMPLCALIGAAIGAALFVRFPQFPYALLVAGIILFYLYLQRHAHLQWSFLKRHDKASGIICGFLSGLCESTANIAAPPLIIYYLGIGLPPLMLVPAMNIGFFVGKSTQFVTLLASGIATPVHWLVTLPLAALAAVSCLYGTRVRSRIDGVTYRRWMLRMLLAIAVFLLAQVVYRHLAG